MLDEHMEKKTPTRGSTVPAKSASTETKNKQDGAGSGAKFARSARRREGPVSKQDTAAKLQQPQRQKGNHDKRFQSKNVVASTNDRRRNQAASENEAEIGSADRPGSKKLNLNHLLNFTYERPDGARTSSNQPWGGCKESRGRGIWATRKHKYNKEQFLQANCQFVVQGGHDYSVHSSDPDLLVDWQWIEQVRVNGHEVPSCPICLYPPVAAKMTRCGHIYCWPCILHYLALSDKTWRKCPICYEAVHKTDLKSVATSATHCFNAGDTISMQLMQREKGSVAAMPKARWKKTADRPFRLDGGTDQCYAKLLLAHRRQVLENVIEREEAELDEALRELADCPEVCFVEAAIEQLKERKTALLAISGVLETESFGDEDDLDESISKCKDDAPTENDRASPSDEAEDRARGATASTPDAEEEPASMAAAKSDGGEDGADEKRRASASSPDAGSNRGSLGGLPSEARSGSRFYYFYQACDGQHVYMNAINVHMLVREFGSLETSPDVITAVIVEKEGISMNEGLRKRLRYLGHLPLICEFEVVELQLEAPVVSRETVDAFAEEIEKRRRRRNRRAREEHKRERQFQADENRMLGKFPEARLPLNSLKHFPECSTRCDDEDADAVLPPCRDDSNRSSPASQSMADAESPISENLSSGPSFAQMLRKGKMNTDANPRRLPAASAKCGAPVSRERNAACSSDDDDDDASLHAPSFRDSFCAALQDALDRSAAVALSDEQQQPDGRKKKRGRQKRLLFTTAVARSK